MAFVPFVDQKNRVGRKDKPNHCKPLRYLRAAIALVSLATLVQALQVSPATAGVAVGAL